MLSLHSRSVWTYFNWILLHIIISFACNYLNFPFNQQQRVDKTCSLPYPSSWFFFHFHFQSFIFIFYISFYVFFIHQFSFIIVWKERRRRRRTLSSDNCLHINMYWLFEMSRRYPLGSWSASWWTLAAEPCEAAGIRACASSSRRAKLRARCASRAAIWNETNWPIRRRWWRAKL